MTLYSELFYSSEVNSLFTQNHMLDRMLQVESALIQAQAQSGIVPVSSANIISDCCDAGLLDLKKLKAEMPLGANAAIPLVKQLIRIVKNNDFEASRYVHLGATSQDIVDTSAALAINQYAKWLDDRLYELTQALCEVTKNHRSTLMIGRTLMQQAKPITFGLKSAYWLQGVSESRNRLAESRKRVACIQLGGPVGGGGKFIPKEVRIDFASRLGLEYHVPWQTNRGNLVEWLSNLAILSGYLGKIAKDVSLMMQTEIGEISEGAIKGKGGSSTMPHKRNPVTSSLIIANATRIPHLISSVMSSAMQEYERSAGLWHAEWEPMEQIMRLTAGSVEKSIDLIKTLEVRKDSMLHNLEATHGLIYAENVSLAISEYMGKGQAHEWVEEQCKNAVRENRPLLEILRESGKKIPGLDQLFDPSIALSTIHPLIDEILENYEDSL